MFFSYLQQITFAHPFFLWLLFGVLFLIIWYSFFTKKYAASFKVSTTTTYQGLQSWKNLLVHVPFICRVFCLGFFIVGLARPQIKNVQTFNEGEGIDIILCIDVSGSMAAQDFLPNRIEAAKKQAIDFIQRRQTDRIGVVIFAGESFTLCPLTTDKAVLTSSIENIQLGQLVDGTSIGDGLATSVNRLKQSTSKTKIIVLLTDGVNNGGLMGADNAKEIAKALETKVYTIGMGTNGMAPYTEKTLAGPITSYEKVTIDEVLLQNIAAETGGKYFRAKDDTSLVKIYTEINQLEKSKILTSTITNYTEQYYYFIWAGLFFLLVEILIKYFVLHKFP
jgi:Ca-activated chloride channel homolog